MLSVDDIADEYYELIEELAQRKMNYDTMVGGFAEWIQQPPKLTCAQCGSRLQQLMQIGSESKAGIMFGDAGAAYFMFCENHPQPVQFFIQCF